MSYSTIFYGSVCQPALATIFAITGKRFSPRVVDRAWISGSRSPIITSIERVGPCRITAPPETKGFRVPSQPYPKESVDKHEEGTVIMELKLDPEWCVRKATIVQSTGFWRLDRVSLSYMMTVKYMPKPETIKQTDGEPTVTFKLGWGASQGKH